jgi:hypothetical protein
MNLNFPPIVYSEFFIDTVDQFPSSAPTHKLSDPALAPFPATGWLRDLEFEYTGGGHPRPMHFDLSNLGNEGELLSIMAWLCDRDAFRTGTSNIAGGVTSESCFKHMKIFIGSFDFREIGISSAPVGDPLNYPDPFPNPGPTDLVYVSDMLYPGFTESVTPGGPSTTPTGVAGTRMPFFQENFATPIPYRRGDQPHNDGQLGMGIVWKFYDSTIGGPSTPRSVMKIKITARRYR